MVVRSLFEVKQQLCALVPGWVTATVRVALQKYNLNVKNVIISFKLKKLKGFPNLFCFSETVKHFTFTFSTKWENIFGLAVFLVCFCLKEFQMAVRYVEFYTVQTLRWSGFMFSDLITFLPLPVYLNRKLNFKGKPFFDPCQLRKNYWRRFVFLSFFNFAIAYTAQHAQTGG